MLNEVTCELGNFNLQEEDSWKLIHRFYTDKYNVKQLGGILGISPSRILRNFKKYNLPLISREEVLSRMSDNYKKTMQETYGVSNASQLKSVKDKRENTNLIRYGVTCNLNAKSCIEKKKNTWLQNYGVDNPSKSSLIHEKKKDTWLNNYGVDNISKSDKNRKLIRELHIGKFKDCTLDSFLGEGYSLAEEYQGKYLNGGRNSYRGWVKYRILHEDCGLTFEHDLNEHPRCPRCFPPKYGASQNEIADFIKNIIVVRLNDRSSIQPYEIDILAPELNIGFEYNGTFWHSSIHKDKNYHKNKTELALTNNIKLYHIWEHDNIEIVKSMIKSKLGKIDNKYYARKLDIKEVSSGDRKLFFDTNHLHGDVKSKFALGLYCKDELISCISFRTHKEGIEIARFATKLNSSCIGGFSRLLKYAIAILKDMGYNKIVTYCDRDWTPDYRDSTYFKNGFKFVGDTGVQLKYTDGTNIFTRETFQKHKLKKLFPDTYRDDLTANYILEKNKIYTIHNSGNWKFELEI